MSAGYTFTTLSAEPGEPMHVGMSFHLGGQAWIAVHGITSGRPFLSISHGEVSVRISPAPGEVTGEDARIARSLADHAATYAAELERLCADNDASGPGTAAA